MGSKSIDWGKFIKQQRRRYMHIAMSNGFTVEEAEDIVWGVYLRLLEKNYPASKMGAYGGRAVRNACINIYVKRSTGRSDHFTVNERELYTEYGVNVLDDLTPVELASIGPMNFEDITGSMREALSPYDYKFIMAYGDVIAEDGHGSIHNTLSKKFKISSHLSRHHTQRIRKILKEKFPTIFYID